MFIRKRVLIIDGEGNYRNLCDALQKKCADLVDVVVVHSSGEGMAKVSHWKPDLIVLEIMIPGGLNGFDVLHLLKTGVDTKNIPVIVYTKLNGEEKTAKDEGALDYFVSPTISPQSVIEKVIQYLNRLGPSKEL